MWEDFLLYVAVGLVAQMVDGAIGMAYGVTASSVLMSMGIPPSTTSACVHAAETFTTGASGAAHWRLGNVDKKLVLRLAIPGMIGGAIGAYVLSNIDGNAIKPFIAALSADHGPLHRLSGAAQNRRRTRAAQARGASRPCRRLRQLDRRRRLGAHRHHDADRTGHRAALRHRLGESGRVLRHAHHLADFLFTIGLEFWPIITGLIVGGVVAAPFAALAAKHVPDKPLMLIVGCVVIILSLRNIIAALN